MTTKILAAALFLALSAGPGFAQSPIDGTWSGTLESSQGDYSLTVTLASDGAELTGTISDFFGGQSEIENGSIRGDTISFEQTYNPRGDNFHLTYVGHLVDSELEMVLEAPEVDERIEFVLRRDD